MRTGPGRNSKSTKLTIVVAWKSPDVRFEMALDSILWESKVIERIKFKSETRRRNIYSKFGHDALHAEAHLFSVILLLETKGSGCELRKLCKLRTIKGFLLEKIARDRLVRAH